ncbi:ATP-binding protein, partial [Listeria seeligeri]|nr:ATP-binding protein [Listeria seeligeri]
QYINDTEPIKQNAIDFLKLEAISNELAVYFNSADEISKLKMHLEFQKVHQSSWKSTNIEHLNPLFNRIDSAFTSLSKVIEIVPDISDSFKTMNVISLVHANQEITRLIPMLLSKMIYDEQKDKVAGNIVTCTKHLIIDEAHNILNAEYRNHGDDWQDYRMSVFEEIVKEGRKFGFYLTLSSQRPADISPTILSQIHNYLIHRLVNEKDLRMLENTMPTLDKSSYQMIPSLG